MNDVALAVGQDLNLDVTWSRQQLLHKYRAVAECSLRFALTACERRRHLIRSCNRAHPAPATARRRFQHDRVADLFGNCDGFVCIR